MSGPAPIEGFRVVVGPLSADVTESALRGFFSSCGLVTAVSLVSDNGSGGYGSFPGLRAVISFLRQDSATKAVTSFHLNPLLGGNIQVCHVQPPDVKVFVGDLPPDLYEEDLKALFQSYTDLNEVHLLPPKGTSGNRCGFVRFGSQASANRAIAEL
eukprot:RCo047642